MFKQARITLLKARLGSAYRAYMAASDHLDCGAQLAAHINPDVARLRNRCNRLLGILAKLDPDNCPCTRIA
ncbi:hypothetical protein ACOTFH_27375 [Achromobacter xylosoxidans]|uniref:Uncharacterized protein n=1 Tax=Achromobacter ruhlandii TaxID=72557 RepID=A0ABM8M0R1_9BURK|nr:MULTISPECIES: hypothetical protein [Achromobacter]CAB3955753.1 hypothetical protein LMG7053_04793 [Achromobacter ruhlandii]